MRKVGYCIFLLFLTATCLPLATALNASDFSGSDANNCSELPCTDAGEILVELDSKPIKMWKTPENNYLIISENGFMNLFSLSSTGFEEAWQLEVDSNGNISSAAYFSEFNLVVFGNETGAQVVDVGPAREKGRFIYQGTPVVDVAWDPTDGADLDSDGITDLPHIWIAVEASKRAVQYDINLELPTAKQTNEHANHIGSVMVLDDGTIITGGDDEIFVHEINQADSMILTDTLEPGYSGTFDIIMTNDDQSKIYFSEFDGRKIISYDYNKNALPGQQWTTTSVTGQGTNPSNIGFEQISSTLYSMDETLILGTQDKLFFINAETMVKDQNQLNYPLGVNAIVDTIYGGLLVTSGKNVHLLDFDSDNDGVTDTKDAFPGDPSQAYDLDGDGCGDNLEGNYPDYFPDDEFECVDTDGDGVGDNGDDFPNNENEWEDSDGDGYGDNSDAFPDEDSQWEDSDGDGFGDNPEGQQPDDCPEQYGTSSIDRYGCVDGDGDGYSNPIEGEDNTNADLFPNDETQWKDWDEDGFGDNPDGNGGDDCPLDFGTSNKTLEYNEETGLWLTPSHFGCKDLDGDGFADSTDQFDNDPNEWLDADNDGVGGNSDYNDNDDSYSTLEGKCALQDQNNLSEDCVIPEDNIKSEEELKQEQLQASIKQAGLYGSIAFVVIIAAILIVGQIFKALSTNKRMKIEKDSIGNKEVMATESGEGFEYDSTFSEDSAWSDDPVDELNVNSEAMDAAFDEDEVKTDPLEENNNDEDSDDISEQPIETPPEQPTEVPPIPESGLPEGWTMDQWKWYGAEWLEKNK
ncbi:MAG: hypothetical protein CMB48_04420 [Euryarchaeota archaeon]|nr:hypothetical protein [Euryarchaeota archaeon]|tara:strand:- start:14201 stop:16609 length:2409 start_codon:yes stop_codon:yes gene_type:complete